MAVLVESNLASAGITSLTAGPGLAADGVSDTLPFTVTKQAQAIDFPAALDHSFGDAPFGVSAAVSPGLPVSLSVSGQGMASGYVVTLTGGGACTLTASQAGNGASSPAPDAGRTFTVAAAGPTSTPTPTITPTLIASGMPGGSPTPSQTPIPAGTSGARVFISVVLAGSQDGWQAPACFERGPARSGIGQALEAPERRLTRRARATGLQEFAIEMGGRPPRVEARSAWPEPDGRPATAATPALS